MKISAIVAMSQNHVIGKDNQLPWHLPADLKHFKKITMGHHILMGRKTFESIGCALPGRLNIIITHDKNFQANDCVIVHSIDEAILAAKESAEIFVIGGALLFQQMMPKIDRLYLTIIHADFDGDVFFPELNVAEWETISEEYCSSDSVNQYDYSFILKEKVAAENN